MEAAFNYQLAEIGDTVQFIRRGTSFRGEVLSIRENSVVVEVSSELGKVLGYTNNFTVVSHKNYHLVNSSESEMVLSPSH